ATVVHPANKRLISRLRRPGLASLLTTSVTVVVLGAPLVFACITVVKGAKNSFDAATQHSSEDGAPRTVSSATDRIVDLLAKRLPIPKESIRAEVRSGMQTATRYLLGITRGFIVSTTAIVVTTVFATIFLFYVLR